jgi:putative transposase
VHYYLSGDLERRISQFVDFYNHERYHESLNNLTPADVFCGRGQQILNKRQNIKLKTLALRKQMHYRKRLQHNPMS